MKKLLLALLFICTGFPAVAQTFPSAPPYVFTAGTVFIPSQMMADWASMIAAGNAVVQNMQFQLNQAGAIPSGALIYFNLSNCPSGYTDVEAANSSLLARHIRGLDLGKGLDTTGTNVGGTEGNAIAAHTHIIDTYITSVTTPWVLSFCTSGCFAPLILSFTNEGNTGAVTGATTGPNNPEEAALLLCSKN